MAVALKVDLNKKGAVVSNHTGSVRAGTLNEAMAYAGQRALDNQWGSGYNEDCLEVCITIWDSYPQKQALLHWLVDHAHDFQVTTTTGRKVWVSWKLQDKNTLWKTPGQWLFE